MSTCSPLPWRVDHERVAIGGASIDHRCFVRDANGVEVASTGEYRSETFASDKHQNFSPWPSFKNGEAFPMGANAELIVRAVNAHDELLAACKKVVEHFGDPACGELFGLRAAIAKAEGVSHV